MNDQFTGYMCKVNFDYDSQGEGGVTIFHSEEELRRIMKCVKQCGIVKVTVTLDSVVQQENYDAVIEND